MTANNRKEDEQLFGRPHLPSRVSQAMARATKRSGACGTFEKVHMSHLNATMVGR
jgi:hypothetical protein